MQTTSIGKLIRYSKMIILFTVATLAFLVIFGNITDYCTNYNFVHHVMNMDTLKEGQGKDIMYRAITNPVVHHIVYIVLITIETTITILGFVGVYKMWRNRNKSAEEFHNSKKLAIITLTLCCLLWFFGFQAVGAEWFGMWMSTWNGLPDANRLVTYMFIGLVYISMKNDN